MWTIPLPNFQQMVEGSEINFQEARSTLKLVEKFIYPWQRILIIDGLLIQLAVVYAHTKVTILHSNKQNQSAPRRDILLNKTFG